MLRLVHVQHWVVVSARVQAYARVKRGKLAYSHKLTSGVCKLPAAPGTLETRLNALAHRHAVLSFLLNPAG